MNIYAVHVCVCVYSLQSWEGYRHSHFTDKEPKHRDIKELFKRHTAMCKVDPGFQGRLSGSSSVTMILLTLAGSVPGSHILHLMTLEPAGTRGCFGCVYTSYILAKSPFLCYLGGMAYSYLRISKTHCLPLLLVAGSNHSIKSLK